MAGNKYLLYRLFQGGNDSKMKNPMRFVLMEWVLGNKNFTMTKEK
jgi:hypothetical protein